MRHSGIPASSSSWPAVAAKTGAQHRYAQTAYAAPLTYPDIRSRPRPASSHRDPVGLLCAARVIPTPATAITEPADSRGTSRPGCSQRHAIARRGTAQVAAAPPKRGDLAPVLGIRVWRTFL
jgi:hypothetical protein